MNLPAALRMGEPDAGEALADAVLSGYALSDLLAGCTGRSPGSGEDAAPLTSSPAR